MNPNEKISTSGQSKTDPAAGNPLLSREDQLAQVQKFYGGHGEIIRLTDPRIPQMLKDDFQRLKITEPNEFIAVPCGAPSNLAAIILPFNPGLVEFNEFIALNPLLDKSLTTCWYKVAFLWVRLEGWRPANRALRGALWISSGLLPAIVERVTTDGSRYFQKNDGSILTLKFADIKWSPETHETFLLECIEEQHGKLILQTGPRKRIFNVQTAAHYLAAALGIIFDKNAGQLFICRPGAAQLEPLTKAKLSELVSTILQKHAAKCPDTFSIVNNQVNPIVTLLKQITAAELPDERDGLVAFVRNQLERRSGADLTTSEIFSGYIENCKALGVRKYPECVFRDVLPTVIREHHGLTKSHNIRRPHEVRGEPTCRNGFNGLAFRPQSAADARDSKDRRDKADGVV